MKGCAIDSSMRNVVISSLVFCGLLVGCYSTETAQQPATQTDAGVVPQPDASAPKDAAPMVEMDAGLDAAPGTDAGATDATVEAGPPDPRDLNGCTAATYVDMTAMANIAIDWGFGTVPPGSCLLVKQGTTITWNGALDTHPLGAQGGTLPSPITGASTGTSVSYTFNDPGVFGYICTIHASMTGAIQVVP